MTGAIWAIFCCALIGTAGAAVFRTASLNADVAVGRDPEIGKRLEASEFNGMWLISFGYALALWATFAVLVLLREVFG